MKVHEESVAAEPGSNGHQGFYSRPYLYEVAFSYRGFDAECDFLAKCFSDFTGRQPASFMELAAGPAGHTREFASRGVASSALDLSPEMVAYATSRAKEDSLSIDYQVGDMTSFNTTERFDLAACMICSFGYLLTNHQVYEHLQSVARVLKPDGLYVIELEHPKSVFQLDACTQTEWEVETADGLVRINWNSDGSIMDPVTQQANIKARIEHLVEDKVVDFIEDCCQMRSFTATEMNSLVDASGCFEVVSTFGALSHHCALDDEKAWRMIFVLKKRGSETEQEEIRP